MAFSTLFSRNSLEKSIETVFLVAPYFKNPNRFLSNTLDLYYRNEEQQRSNWRIQST